MKILTFLLIGLGWMASEALAAPAKPNVVVIMTDQQSHTMMSCMGNTWLKTPAMDQLAERGYRFEKNYCANPVCMPSRFSLLTGHYASEVGVKDNTPAYNAAKVQAVVTEGGLGQLFRRAGYNTLYSGKTHLYGSKDASNYGFKLNSLDPYDGPALYAEKVLAEFGKARPDRPFLLFLSFLNPHDICYKAGAIPGFPESLPPDTARETVRLLAKQKSLTPDEYRRQVPPRAANRAPINGEQPNLVSPGPRAWDDAQWDLYNWMYHRLTESVDAQIGRVLAALQKSGLEDNTIIVFTSDHGDMNGAHGLAMKGVMFEECQRVPFIFVGPGIKRGVADRTTLTCNGLDLLPTICDLAGFTPPAGLPGVSLKPFLLGAGPTPERQYIVTESHNAHQINDGRYKYTVYELPGHPELLTDLVENPGETKNFADDPAYADRKAALKQQLMLSLGKRGLLPLPEGHTLGRLRDLDRGAGKAGKRKAKANAKAEN